MHSIDKLAVGMEVDRLLNGREIDRGVIDQILPGFGESKMDIIVRDSRMHGSQKMRFSYLPVSGGYGWKMCFGDPRDGCTGHYSKDGPVFEFEPT